MPEQNRFQLEEDVPSGTKYERYESTEAAAVYFDEPDPQTRSRKRFRLFLYVGFALLLLAGLGLGVYLTYFAPGAGANVAGGKSGLNFQKGDADGPRDRFYFPTGDFGNDFRQALAYYTANERAQAKRAFENLLVTDAPGPTKAAALTYLAIMAMESDRFVSARHQLERALKHDPASVAVLVNLAIAERRLDHVQQAQDYAQKALALAPNDPRVRMLLGNIRSATDLPAAEQDYREAMNRSPGDPDLVYNLALSLLKQQKHAEAAAEFRRAIELSRDIGQVAVLSHAHLAQIHFAAERYAAAEDEMVRAVTLAPANGRYLYNLGVIRLKLGRNQEALESLRQALAAGSGEPQVLRSLAEALRNLKETGMAIEALKKALYANPNDPATLFALADLYYEDRDLLNAAESLQKIVRITPGDRNTQDALLKLGAVYVELEKHADAVDVLKRALELNSKSAPAWYSLGAAYSRWGKPDLAAAAWRRALSDQVSDGAPLEVSDERRIRLALAGLYRGQGALEQAVEQYRLVLALKDRPGGLAEDPRARLELGRAYLALKDGAAAARELRVAAEAKSASAQVRREAFLELARAYGDSQRPEDRETARSYAYRAARMGPDDPQTRLVQASILLKTDSLTDRERAIEILQAVANSDIEPGAASSAHNLLGLAYYKNGDFGRALSAFQYAVQLDPSNKDAYSNQRLAAEAAERGPR